MENGSNEDQLQECLVQTRQMLSGTTSFVLCVDAFSRIAKAFVYLFPPSLPCAAMPYVLSISSQLDVLESMHILQPRWYQNDGYTEYTLHARLLGGMPAKVGDALPSALLGLLSMALLAGAGFRAWKFIEYRTSLLWAIMASLFFNFLAWFIRAGLAGKTQSNQVSFMVECIFFTIGQYILVDTPAFLLSRDFVITWHSMRANGIEVYEKDMDLTYKPHFHTRFTLAARALIIPSTILSIIGYTKLPDPGQTEPPSRSSTSYRLAGSLIVFLLMLANIVICLANNIINKPKPYGAAIVYLVQFLVFMPTLYAFLIVAVTVDNGLVTSHVFFYIAYGLCQSLVVILVLALPLYDLHRTRHYKYFMF